jgi:hypothetical protein
MYTAKHINMIVKILYNTNSEINLFEPMYAPKKTPIKTATETTAVTGQFTYPCL